ncbi:MAG: SRPBCC domain-containing protein [Pelolinea sp.]|nr:SRPBCC domain-containing protein [Pelolinea sp.]
MAIIPAPINSLWEVWTTEAGIRSFFARDCHIDLRVNGEYKIYFNPNAHNGERGAEGTRILAIQPNILFSFTWNNPPSIPVIRWQYTHVSLYFTSIDAKQTKLLLEHDGWGEGANWEMAFAYFDRAWNKIVFPRLVKRFVSGPIDWDSV